uniref:SMC5-SMC6 complex localization factor protein 2-like n=1 Tax=Fundulus heteroclitus TaxID=8078 RepID=A0A3Q2NQX1_FUNHE
MDLDSTSKKRHREEEPGFKNIKRPFLKETNYGTTETTKPTPGTSPRSSLDPQPSLKNSSVFELSAETTKKLQRSVSAGSGSSFTLKSSQLNFTSSEKATSEGAKKGFITTENNIVRLIFPPSPSKDIPKKQNEENQKDKSSSSKTHRECSKTAHAGAVYSNSDHTDCILAKTESKSSDGRSQKPASKPGLESVSCRTTEHSKASRVRRPAAAPDNLDQLFTPDPNVYVVRPGCKTPKFKKEEQTIKSPTKTGSSPKSSCHPTGTPASSAAAQPPHVASNSAAYLPVVTLERLKLGKSKGESTKPHHNHSPKPETGEGLCCSETDTAASLQETVSPHRKTPPLEEEKSEGSRGMKEEDSIDIELDHSLNSSDDLKLKSDSSGEELLISFKEMMARDRNPPDRPTKDTFSEPSTPGCRSSQLKTWLLPFTSRPVAYKNNLDQMLKEINRSKKAKEIEAQLLTACQEDLLKLVEYEEAEENQAEITAEHQEFLQHFSLMTTAFREIPPGEVVFNLEKFGQIFDQDTLQLRECPVSPQGISQKTLLWSSHAQLRVHLNIGLFELAYCNSPCSAQILSFLFKMMSVHSERIVSEKILQDLCDIARFAAYQIAHNDNQQFEVWVPSLADVTLVFMNMGAAFVTLFPFESLQPSFTEGDLLEDVYVKSESPSKNKEEIIFPEHNCINILKYLSYSMSLCPRAYSDYELLLLLTVVGRVTLETQRILQPIVEGRSLLYNIINNISDWSSMLPRICKALTDLTDDHHNMCLLVQLLPDSKRGIRLRRHVSLCFISKLLDGNCTYTPQGEEPELAGLRPYLPQIRPSALLRRIQQKDQEEDMFEQDQRAYYLCYSLLTLISEASTSDVFLPDQKAQLLVLSSELEMHIKCDIRESEKCLYHSKVKDLVARIYTKWQMLLQKVRPLNDKLYDYWQPLETFGITEQDGESTFIEDEETTGVEDTMIDENDIKETEEREVKEDMEMGGNPGDDEHYTKMSETTAAAQQVTCDKQNNACDAASSDG